MIFSRTEARSDDAISVSCRQPMPSTKAEDLASSFAAAFDRAALLAGRPRFGISNHFAAV